MNGSSTLEALTTALVLSGRCGPGDAGCNQDATAQPASSPAGIRHSPVSGNPNAAAALIGPASGGLVSGVK